MSDAQHEGNGAPRRRRLWVAQQSKSKNRRAEEKGVTRVERGFQNSEVVRRTYKQTQEVLAGILSARDRIIVRNRLMAVATFLVVIAALVASISNYITTNSTPEQAVNSYMRALERGSYFSALDRSAYSDGAKTYIKSAAFRNAAGRVQDYRIASLEYDGPNDATAHLEVKIHDRWAEYSLPLARTEKEGLFNDAWRLAQPAQVNQVVVADFALDEIVVNDRAVSLGDSNKVPVATGGSAWNLVVLPGEYFLSTPADSYYSLAGEQQEFTVPLGEVEVPAVALRVRPSERMWSETNQAIEDALAKCIDTRSLAPSGCPASRKYSEVGISLGGRNAVPITDGSSEKGGASDREQVRIEDIRWSLRERPVLALEQNADNPTLWESQEYRPTVLELTYIADGEAQRETIEVDVAARVESKGKSATIDVALEQPGGKK